MMLESAKRAVINTYNNELDEWLLTFNNVYSFQNRVETILRLASSRQICGFIYNSKPMKIEFTLFGSLYFIENEKTDDLSKLFCKIMNSLIAHLKSSLPNKCLDEKFLDFIAFLLDKK